MNSSISLSGDALICQEFVIICGLKGLDMANLPRIMHEEEIASCALFIPSEIDETRRKVLRAEEEAKPFQLLRSVHRRHIPPL